MQVIVKKTTKKNGDLPEPECRPGPVGANSAMRTRDTVGWVPCDTVNIWAMCCGGRGEGGADPSQLSPRVRQLLGSCSITRWQTAAGTCKPGNTM